MNMCQVHWNSLRKAIDDRGLSKFVANDGPQLIEHLTRDINGSNTLLDFEPLVGSSMAIANLAMSIGGLALMTPNEDETMPCPVCFLQSFDYVSAAADGALAEAHKRGLID